MSGPISELFGASAGGFYEQKLILSSGTFTCPSDGMYLVTGIGGGAAGTNSGRGGGAGGMFQRLFRLSRGTVITLTVGAGGASNGASGGFTVITMPGVYLQADGGTATAGGPAAGGDVNITGGASGNALGSGGGAVGIYGVGYSSTTAGLGGAGTGGQNSGIDGGTALPNRNGSSGYAGGRILLPVGRGGNQTYPDGEAGGGGRGGSGVNGGNAGIFAGGGGAGTGFNGGSGGLGGGGGGSANSSGGAGGNGCVIIEFYRS